MNHGDTFGAFLRALRHQKFMSQEVLAERANVGVPYISKIERGHNPPPNAETLVRIAVALDADPDEVLVRAGKAPPDLLRRLSTDLAFVKRVRALLH